MQQQSTGCIYIVCRLCRLYKLNTYAVYMSIWCCGPAQQTCTQSKSVCAYLGSLLQGHLPMQHHKAQLVFSQGVCHEMQSLDKGAEDNHFLGSLGPLLCVLHPNSPHESEMILTGVTGRCYGAKGSYCGRKGRCCGAKGKYAQPCYVTGHLGNTMKGISALQEAVLAQQT